MNETYRKSMEKLKEYLKKKRMPTEKEWNRYAVSEKLLSAQTMSFVSRYRFS